MFKRYIGKLLSKPVKLIYYSSLKGIIADDANTNTSNRNIIVGNNSVINPSAIFVCVNNGSIEFEGENYIGRNVEIGANNSKISFGNGTSIQDRCIILGDIEIGRYCVFAPNIYISSGRHYYDFKPELYIQDQDSLVRNDVTLSKNHSRKVIIEDDCWLGINVVVMGGVRIGKGSVIGANAVVTKNVEPYSVMAGSPAKLIKKRLNFELKDSLYYLNDADLPYFYNGFNVNLKNLTIDRKEGGISVRQNFTAYLNGEGKKKITLKVKSSKLLKISYFNQIKEIPIGDFSDISFDIKGTKFHQFKISLDEEIAAKILIQSITST